MEISTQKLKSFAASQTQNFLFSLSGARFSADLEYRTIFLHFDVQYLELRNSHISQSGFEITLYLTNSGGEGKSAAEAVGIYRL
jgi:hypothetical protein